MNSKLLDSLVNDFAIRSFRDMGDGDYIAARLAYRAQLIPQFLWSGLQCIEKYLKCIMVLNRVEARKTHDLTELLGTLTEKVGFEVTLHQETKGFLTYLDRYGANRYFEVPYYSLGHELIDLDRSVWDIRRYARILNYELGSDDQEGDAINMLRHELQQIERSAELPPHKFRIHGGKLEKIVDDLKHPSREALLWQNGYFGVRARSTVKMTGRMESANSPLSLHPEIIEEVCKYAFVPKNLQEAYRKLAAAG